MSSLPIAVYAAFFSLRVDISRDRHALFTREGALRLPPRSSLLARLQRKLIGLVRHLAASPTEKKKELLRTYCNYCSSCGALTLSHEYSHADLEPLYADYRSAGYNADRMAVEPSYGPIAHLVGQDPVELSSRNSGVARFLQDHLPARSGRLALDLGGSDGRFIPQEVLERFRETHIIDTSQAAVAPQLHARGARKVLAADSGGYALVMCMHVLEHVGNPRGFVLDALCHLRPGGLLYLEVPVERDAGLPAHFEQRLVDRVVMIHEHINQYADDSIAKLVSSVAGLKLLQAESEDINCGWSTGRVARVLAQRVG